MEKARQLALVSILAIRPLADVFKLVTWICHRHCHIVLDCPVLLVGIELASSSNRVTSVKSAKIGTLSSRQTSKPTDRTPDTLGSDKNFDLGSRGMPYWHYQLVLSWYLYQQESHQLSFKKVSKSVRDNQTHRSDQETWVR